MRHLVISLLLALAACMSVPMEYAVDVVAGHYRKSNGPELWQELDLRPGGECTSWFCTNRGGFSQRTPTAGRWDIEQGRIVITPEQGSLWRLMLRRWRGHVYLVPSSTLEWFDSYGPEDESCFSRDGAPTLGPPPYFKAGYQARP